MLAFAAFLGSPLGKLIGYALITLTLAGTVLGVKHEWDLGQAARVQVTTIRKANAVQVKAVAKADASVLKADTVAQTRIATVTRIIHERIPTYVTARTPCIPWSVVRVHDAATLGVDPSTLSLPAGQSPDACSDVSPAAFMAGIADNYAAARANAQQLNDLIADASAREKAVAPAPSVVAP